MEMNERKKNIKKILREGISPDYQEPISTPTPTVDEADGEGVSKERPSAGQYSRLKELLSNDIINHSGVIRRMKSWGDADDTERSLFRKKLNREKNDQGGVYEFTKEEVEDIFNILNDISKKMSIKREGK